MRAGDLRQKVDILSYTTTRNSHGELEQTWSVAFRNLRAEFKPVLGPRNRETQFEDQVGYRQFYRFRLRYRTGITKEMRVRYLNQEYEIQAAYPADQMNHELHLMCYIHD